MTEQTTIPREPLRDAEFTPHTSAVATPPPAGSVAAPFVPQVPARVGTPQRASGTGRAMPSDASLRKGAMAAAAVAPFALRAVSKWRANPKHKKVRDHMSTGAVVVREHETVAMAARKLEECEIGALPVGRGGDLVGVVTDRDIVTQVVAQGLDPETTFVRDLGLNPPVVIAAHDSIQNAAKLMMRYGVRRLPVIDHERVVGMIAQADIASAIGPEKAGLLLEAISEAPANS